MGEYWNVDRLTKEWEARGLSRRDLMKLVGAGAGGAAVATLMKHDAALAQGTPSPAPVTPSGGEVSVLWRAPVTLNPLYSSSGNEQCTSLTCSSNVVASRYATLSVAQRSRWSFLRCSIPPPSGGRGGMTAAGAPAAPSTPSFVLDTAGYLGEPSGTSSCKQRRSTAFVGHDDEPVATKEQPMNRPLVSMISLVAAGLAFSCGGTLGPTLTRDTTTA